MHYNSALCCVLDVILLKTMFHESPVSVQDTTKEKQRNISTFPSPPFSARREKPFGKSESAAVGNFVRLGRNGRGEKNWKIEGFRGRLGYLRNLHALCARKVPAASQVMFVLTRNYLLQRSHISKGASVLLKKNIFRTHFPNFPGEESL